MCIILHDILSCSLTFSSELIIGFDSDSYTVSESDGTVSFIVRILSGTIDGRTPSSDVVVEFFTGDGSALGELT